MGNMIGSGVFLLPGALAPYGWNAVAGWPLTIAGSVALAIVIARLTVALPQSVGATVIIAEAFGPLAGFAMGWIYWISVITTNVTLAVSAIAALSPLFPFLAKTPFAGVAAALGLLWLLTLLNLRGAGAAGRFQIVTLLLKIVPILVAAVLIVMVLLRDGTPALQPLPSAGLDIAHVTGAAALTLWAMVGFESASIGADKITNPARNIPLATVTGTVSVGLLYLFVCSGVGLMLDPAEAASDAPFAAFVARYWSTGPAALVTAFVAISCIGALNGWTLLQGELPLAMARAGELPAWFGKTDARGTPVRALLLSTIFASLLLLANSLNGLVAIFAYMALLSTAATLWLYLGCALAALRFRIAIPAALAGVVYAFWTLHGAGWGTSLLSLALMLAGLPLYWWTRRSAAAQPAH